MENQLQLEQHCAPCKGTGKIGKEPCPACQGKGTVLTEEGKKVLNYLRNSIRASEH
ncbi:hypothetical protein [uncultured Sporomusa sp.]|uniref:hypothetical protein n=1 Tax=uncultured Sporomusa sp. TaxID=307249 RepID=UPI00339060EB